VFGVAGSLSGGHSAGEAALRTVRAAAGSPGSRQAMRMLLPSPVTRLAAG
jgi:hypothetical protein